MPFESEWMACKNLSLKYSKKREKHLLVDIWKSTIESFKVVSWTWWTFLWLTPARTGWTVTWGETVTWTGGIVTWTVRTIIWSGGIATPTPIMFTLAVAICWTGISLSWRRPIAFADACQQANNQIWTCVENRLIRQIETHQTFAVQRGQKVVL